MGRSPRVRADYAAATVRSLSRDRLLRALGFRSGLIGLTMPTPHRRAGRVTKRGWKMGARDRPRSIGGVVQAWLLCACLALPWALGSTPAEAQTAPANNPTSTPQPTDSASQPQDNDDTDGEDILRPMNLFQMMYQFKTAPGSGVETGTTATATTDVLRLRMDHAIDIDPSWKVSLRGDLPLTASNSINSSNPDGDYQYGVGDVDIQSVLLHVFNDRWTAGFGARVTAPTGEGNLGTGKWQILPGAAVRYATPEISSGSYFEPEVRWAVSFAGDPSRKNISNLQLAPTFNIALPDRWYVTLFPSTDIRINFGDPVTGQTGRFFLPFDIRVGRKITSATALSLEVSAPIIKDYPVYDFLTELRLNIRY